MQFQPVIPAKESLVHRCAAFRLAFKRGLLANGESWMDMIKSRTLTSHTYNEDVAEKIAADIVNRYFSEFVTLQTKMESLKEEIP